MTLCGSLADRLAPGAPDSVGSGSARLRGLGRRQCARHRPGRCDLVRGRRRGGYDGLVVKLTRVLLLGPARCCDRLARGRAAGGSQVRFVPLFVLLFLLAAAVRSSGVLPAAVLPGTSHRRRASCSPSRCSQSAPAFTFDVSSRWVYDRSCSLSFVGGRRRVAYAGIRLAWGSGDRAAVLGARREHDPRQGRPTMRDVADRRQRLATDGLELRQRTSPPDVGRDARSRRPRARPLGYWPNAAARDACALDER